MTIAGDPADPRLLDEPPAGVVLHRVPELHPDDVTVLHGLRVTAPARTLIDLADEAPIDELRELYAAWHARGIVDREQLVAARARVEWRPALPVVDLLIDGLAA